MRKIPQVIWPDPEHIRNPELRQWAMSLIRVLTDSFEFLVTGDYDAVTKTSNYTITASDDVILCSGAITITLPSPTAASRQTYYIKNINPGLGDSVTLSPNASETIDGASSKTIFAQDAVMCILDGTNWHTL
jgi:hypothetical protein